MIPKEAVANLGLDSLVQISFEEEIKQDYTFLGQSNITINYATKIHKGEISHSGGSSMMRMADLDEYYS